VCIKLQENKPAKVFYGKLNGVDYANNIQFAFYLAFFEAVETVIGSVRFH
jgi:hypothetical protein